MQILIILYLFTGSLRPITYKLSNEPKLKQIRLVPGNKLCPQCQTKVNELLRNEDDENMINVMDDNNNDFNNNTGIDQDIFDIKDQISTEEDKKALNEMFSTIGMSPIKTKGLHDSGKVNLGKRKMSTLLDIVKCKVAKIFKLPEQSFVENDVIEKAEMFDELKSVVNSHLEKLKSTKSKVQIMTLMPTDWPIRKVMDTFPVNKHIVQEARKLVKEKGVLAIPDSKKGKVLPEETIKAVSQIYHDDEYSREMPGKKDCISISRHVYRQKRLLLCNLQELHSEFKNINPNLNVGFSKFCSLRPQWCILAGGTGTHTVCVCTIHQNIILSLQPLGITYKDLIPYFVCDTDNKNCMMRRCNKCLHYSETLKNHLYEIIGDYNENDEIEYKQWTTADRSTMVNCIDNIPQYVEIIINQLLKLAPHSYTAKSQSKYLKTLKNSMNSETIIFLGDFAENYKFIIQDETQSFHWSNLQCTLHPVVVYYKNNEELKHISYCIISDDNDHDTGMVYEIQKRIITDIKKKIPNVKRIEYFTDGCAGQYKNCKNFLNLTHHVEDFNLQAKWNFFATSHGKQPCDGIGGTVKRLTAKASLQRTLQNQILTPQAMFEFCVNNIDNINFIYISSDEMSETRIFLEDRFLNASTIPGTRSFHQFVPLGDNKIATKRCSEDGEIALVHSFISNTKVTEIEVFHFDFVCCLYEQQWWIGMVQDINKEEADVAVKFMHPNGPSPSFKWPSKDDICWVPNIHIICKIDIPLTETGRTYHLSEDNVKKITEAFNRM